MDATPVPLARERHAVLVALLALAGVAWVAVVWQGAPGATGSMRGMQPASPLDTLTMGMTAPVFLATWTVMMAAMMLPSAAPMILTFDAVQRSRLQQGRANVPTWVFVAGYLAVWSAVGIVAYGAALVAADVATALPALATLAPRVGGALFIAAGLYQLTPLKQRCLSHCRTPTQFVLGSWRNGRRGAFRMGLEHGVVCLGCCWLLFAILFPLGIMNVAAMAAAALFVLAEKTLPIGRRLGQAGGAVLMGAGAVIIAVPGFLPVGW
jgi:predicted metal-binding membrane protein